MKKSILDLAYFGGSPLFSTVLPVGQIHIPDWERFKAIADGIFDRRYYANHWILTQELEEKLCQLLKVRNVITMTNATVALSLACKALQLSKGSKVIVPSFTFAATVQALTWAGIEPLFCDVDPKTHNITTETVLPLLDTPGVAAVLGVHLWGNPCDIKGISRLCQSRNIKLFFDAAHAIGCTYNNQPIGNFGHCEVFSFHATKILSATEGGCVTTNDDDLAERFRNLRSSYGRRADVAIPINGNGRFSEMQAAFALLSLEDFPKHCEENRKKMLHYFKRLENIPGLRFIKPKITEQQNYQYVVLEIDESQFGFSRDILVQILEAENIHARRYFVPGMHKSPPYNKSYLKNLPCTNALCEKVFQLPSGAKVTIDTINKICDLIIYLQKNSNTIKEKL